MHVNLDFWTIDGFIYNKLGQNGKKLEIISLDNSMKLFFPANSFQQTIFKVHILDLSGKNVHSVYC